MTTAYTALALRRAVKIAYVLRQCVDCWDRFVKCFGICSIRCNNKYLYFAMSAAKCTVFATVVAVESKAVDVVQRINTSTVPQQSFNLVTWLVLAHDVSV